MRRRKAIITFLFLGFCASALLNVVQNDRAERDKKILSDQLFDLQRQKHAHVLPSHETGASTTSGHGDFPAVAGQSTITVSLFNIKLAAADPITDLVYGEVKTGGVTGAGFTTEALLAEYSACKAGALGTLVRTKAAPTSSPKPTPSRTPLPTKTPTNQPFSKTVGGYTYTYKSPAFTCVTDKPGRDTVAAAVAALKNQALPTLVAQ
jgi:hypothetical protein